MTRLKRNLTKDQILKNTLGRTVDGLRAHMLIRSTRVADNGYRTLCGKPVSYLFMPPDEDHVLCGKCREIFEIVLDT